jgi:NAD(P)-dependent dehydrogenase (short-subunit alcohol dehydrogenase family)
VLWKFRTINKSTVLQRSANLILVDGDIGTKEASIRVVDAAVHHFGRMTSGQQRRYVLAKPFTSMPQDFDLMIHTNVAGYFFVTQQAVADAKAEIRPYRQHCDRAGGSAAGRRSYRTRRPH